MKKIGTDEHVVAAYAEPAVGPGWANTPVWVIVRNNRDGTMRHECIQPDDQSRDMRALYRVASEIHAVMTAEAKQILEKRRK